MIFKVLIFAVVAYALYRLFMNDRKKSAEKAESEEAKKVADGTLVRDPICGTYIEKESSFTVKNGDHIEHFCSHDCRDKYIKQVKNNKNYLNF